MTFMSNRVMLDSSVLIEYVKNSRVELFEALLSKGSLELCYRAPTLNEYLFHFLAIAGGKSPLTLKVNHAIEGLLASDVALDIFKPLSFLSDSDSVTTLTFQNMKQYNLLPNDALILALCHLHQIPYLASFDSDFSYACLQENIILIQSVGDILQIK
jgi:predicted nucleic acid-binding protein